MRFFSSSFLLFFQGRHKTTVVVCRCPLETSLCPKIRWGLEAPAWSGRWYPSTSTSASCTRWARCSSKRWAELVVDRCPAGARPVFLKKISPPTAESFGVSAQIGSGVVRSGPEARFHEGSTRVPPGFHQDSTRFCEGCGVVRALRRVRHAVGDITWAFFWTCIYVYITSTPWLVGLGVGMPRESSTDLPRTCSCPMLGDM